MVKKKEKDKQKRQGGEKVCVNREGKERKGNVSDIRRNEINLRLKGEIDLRYVCVCGGGQGVRDRWRGGEKKNDSK